MKYNILRWDPMILDDGILPKPVIRIKPDSDLLEFVKENEDMLVMITGSNTIYDCKPIVGNLTKCDGNHVVVLNSEWHEYPHPSSLGKLEIYGIDDDDVVIDSETQNILQTIKETRDNFSLHSMSTLHTLMIIVVLVLGMVYYKRK